KSLEISVQIVTALLEYFPANLTDFLYDRIIHGAGPSSCDPNNSSGVQMTGVHAPLSAFKR
ncbi:MAG: hypothetical protein AAB229_03400, partial [Candidatus Hydrogenedentota bacterium]